MINHIYHIMLEDIMTTFMSQPKAHVRKTLLRYTIVTIMATFFIILDIYAVEKIFLISVDNLAHSGKLGKLNNK